MSTGRWFVFLGTVLLCSGCVTGYKVVVEFSPLFQESFREFPTIEVDIAAVTEGEVSEVKQAGVEGFFSPGSGLREQLQPQTCFFSLEDNVNFTLPSRAPVWKTWLVKNPTNILVIASLPHDPSMKPQSDPRYALVKIQKSFILARTAYILVEPQKVIRIPKSSVVKGKTSETPPKAEPHKNEQWIEPRTRRTQ